MRVSGEGERSEAEWDGWAPVLGFAAVPVRPFGFATGALKAHPPNWIQTNLAPRGGPNRWLD